MVVLFLLLGATVIGGLALGDFGGSANTEPETDEFEEPLEEQFRMDFASFSEDMIPLTDPVDDDDTDDGESASEDTDPSGETGTDDDDFDDDDDDDDGDLTLFDGISDEDMGYSNNSFGVAHRFYENSLETEDLIGGDGDDTIYAGAGSTATGGAGSDDFELFIPNGLLGQELFVLNDFNPAEDTLTILLEQDAFDESGSATGASTTTGAVPQTALTPQDDGTVQLSVNGVPVATLNTIDADTPVAVSTDGHGEFYQHADGTEFDADEAADVPIIVAFMHQSELYGY